MNLPITSNVDVAVLRRQRHQRPVTTTALNPYASHVPAHAVFQHRTSTVSIGTALSVTPEPEPQTCTGVRGPAGRRCGAVRSVGGPVGAEVGRC